MDFHSKYLKYKNKYLDLKKKIELNSGGGSGDIYGDYGDYFAKSIIPDREKEEKKIKDQNEEINTTPELKNKIMNKITEIFNEIILESIKPQNLNDSTIKILEALTKDQPDDNEISLLLRYSLFQNRMFKGLFTEVKVKPNINEIKKFVDNIEKIYNDFDLIDLIYQRINKDIKEDTHQRNYNFLNLNKTIELYYSNFIELFNEWQINYKVVNNYLTVIKNKYNLPTKQKFFM
jgi:hypothetical protein